MARARSAEPDFDLAVVGGGPAGSAAAIVAAASGLSVIVIDRQRFPRDKPCGDGVTPRGVGMLARLGLGEVADAMFHRVDGFRIRIPGRQLARPFPHRRAGLPTYGLVARRTELDQLLLDRARSVGAKVVEGARVDRPVWHHGCVVGVETTMDGARDVVRSRVVIGADGATSRIAQAIAVEDRSTVFGYALRAELDSPAGDGRHLEVLPRLSIEGRLVPGYGWAFPLGGTSLNVGVGYVSSGDLAHLPLRRLQEAFFAQIPEEWNVHSGWESAEWKGWKLVMGLGRKPLWRPGIMLVGDAVAAARPTSGAGISKALRSGFLAGATAVAAVHDGTTDDFSEYERALYDELGASYRLGRWFARTVAKPWFMRGITSALTLDPSARIVEDVFSDLRSVDPLVLDTREVRSSEMSSTG